MRFVRKLVASLLVVIIVAGGAAAIVLHNRAGIVRIVLAQINAATGLNIVPAGTHVAFGNHLVVRLVHPRIYLHGVEVARVDDLRAVISYHAIVHSNGLPLYALALDHPIFRVPASLAGVTPAGLPKPDVNAANRLLAALDALSGVTHRVELFNAVLHDVDGAPLIDNLTWVAYREHRRPGHWPWIMSFNAQWHHAPYDGLQLIGQVRLGAEPGTAGEIIAAGRTSFTGFKLARFPGPDAIMATGTIDGRTRFALRQNGELSGTADSTLEQIGLRGRPFTGPIGIGDFSLHTEYSASTERIDLGRISLTRNGVRLADGECIVGQPYDAARTVALRLSGARLALADLSAQLRYFKAVPAWFSDAARRLTAGQLVLDGAAFAPAKPLRDWSAKTLRGALTVHATLSGAAIDSPADLKLPPIHALAASFDYTAGVVAITKGTARLGNSTVAGIDAEADLRGAPASIKYRIRGHGALEAAELYPSADKILSVSAPDLARRLQRVSGTSAVKFAASGRIANLAWSPPDDYLATISPRRIEFEFAGVPGAIVIESGGVSVRPGAIDLAQLLAATDTRGGGSVMLNGTIVPARPTPALRSFVIVAHELRAGTWIPLMVEAKELTVHGAISGRLTADSDLRTGGAPVISGRLTMGPGDLQFGFLRAPLVTRSATLALDGKGMNLELPAATLEGHPVDFKLQLTDFAHPLLHIDAKAAALDFEVLTFIRLPWSPEGTVSFFALPVDGHIEALRANFGKLPMRRVSLDFNRESGQWHVANFVAGALGGKLKFDVSGLSGADNWINIRGHIDEIDAAALCTLAGEKTPALTGQITAAAKLRANTDVDFFNTLEGDIALQVHRGTLNRFALVARIMSFIDLKNWLTAHLPDANATGIPFTSITAGFKGNAGDFTTRDLHLSGPVMHIKATGDVRLSNSTVNMEVSVIPFDTMNWLVEHIPIIGYNLAAGSKGLVAAYFDVRGPISNPSVVPKPITSFAEFVAKTLSIPINVIVPNTIKP